MAKNFRVKNGLQVDAFTGFANEVTTVDASGNLQVSGVTINTITSNTAALSADVASLNQINEDVAEPIGFVNRTDSTLSYDEGTRTLSLSGSYAVYTKGGIRNDFTGESELVDNSSGIHFYYYDDNGDFVNQLNTPWDFEDDAMVAVVWLDSVNGKGILFEERHGIVMDWATHRRLHLVDGTSVETDDYQYDGATLQPSSPSDSDNQITFASGKIHDEDILEVQDAYSAGNYTVIYRSGSGNDYRIDDGNTVPLLAGTYAQWNEFTGGNWQLTEIDNGDFINYFVFATTAKETKYQKLFVPGQAVHASLGDAENEGLTNMDFGTLFPLAEIAPLYKITLRASASYSTTGKVRIEAVTRLIGKRSEITGGAPAAIHNALSGLQGGTLDEYYHLTAAELTDVQDIPNIQSDVAAISGDYVSKQGDTMTGYLDIAVSNGSEWAFEDMTGESNFSQLRFTQGNELSTTNGYTSALPQIITEFSTNTDGGVDWKVWETNVTDNASPSDKAASDFIKLNIDGTQQFAIMGDGDISIGPSSNGNTALYIEKSINSMLDASTINISELHAVFANDTASNGEGAGIGFRVSGNNDEIGAAIVHERTGSSSTGRLHFGTNTGAGGDLPIHMTIDELGEVNILNEANVTGRLTAEAGFDVSVGQQSVIGNDSTPTLPSRPGGETAPSHTELIISSNVSTSNTRRCSLIASMIGGDGSSNVPIYGGMFYARTSTPDTDGDSTSYGVLSQAVSDAANNDAYGVVGQATANGGTSVAYGIYGSATGGGTNWAGYFDGDVAISSLSGNAGDMVTLDANGKLQTSGIPVEIGLACSDETSDLTTGTGKVTIRAPHAFTVNEVRASLTTATSGADLIVDVNEDGTSIFSTLLTIDAGEKTSKTATTAAVISGAAIADDAELTVDIDQVGSATAGAGLKVWILGER